MFEHGEHFYVHPVSGAVRPLTIDLLRSVYLVPAAEPFDLAPYLEAGADAPWSASRAVAPLETARAVESALRRLMLATRDLRVPAVDLSRLPGDSRACRHLAGLLELWRLLGEALPDDLRVMRAVVESSASDAIDRIPILVGDVGTLTPCEQAVIDRLVEHHGHAPGEVQRQHLEAATARRMRAAEGSLLGRVQRHLLAADVASIHPDGTIVAYGVRDAAMEADVAAGMAQKMLDDDPELSPSEIGLLLPAEASYPGYVAEAFARAGLPLSGLPLPPVTRDIGAETIQHFLLSRRHPGPAMALASLLSSPLMPWDAAIGRAMANAVMGGDYDPRAAQLLSGRPALLYRVIRSGRDSTCGSLEKALTVLRRTLSQSPDLQAMAGRARELAARVRSLLAGMPPHGEPPWDTILRMTAPEAAPPQFSPRTLGGVTVLTDGAEPWRDVSHLMVLGFAEGAYPRSVPPSPLFLDSELRLIAERCGLAMPTRAFALERQMDLFRRQIGVASKSMVLLCPRRDGFGARLAPAASLPLLARFAAGVGEPERFVLDLDVTEEDAWPAAVPRALETKGLPMLDPLVVPDQIALGRDLFALRVREDGTIRRQSPSRLESVLVSPLYWLLCELDAVETSWGPEEADLPLLGSLAHAVFERLFTPGSPPPGEADVEAMVPALLAESIRRMAPFMQSKAWLLERQTLEREVIAAARHWRRTLLAHGATVVNNEFWLQGTVFGIQVHGKADCLLRLEDGQLIIVDHKKSRTRRRKQRLEAGWDLQVELYRVMAGTAPEEGVENETRRLLSSSNRVGVAYHLMDDAGVLLHGADVAPHGEFLPVASDISHHAMQRLGEEVARLRKGEVRLNRAEDRKFFTDEARISPYALDASPLIGAFTCPPEAEE